VLKIASIPIEAISPFLKLQNISLGEKEKKGISAKKFPVFRGIEEALPSKN
jgi:hypothetical protein